MTGLRGLLFPFCLSSLALIRLVEQPIRVIPLSDRFSLLCRLKSRTWGPTSANSAGDTGPLMLINSLTFANKILWLDFKWKFAHRMFFKPVITQAYFYNCNNRVVGMSSTPYTLFLFVICHFYSSAVGCILDQNNIFIMSGASWLNNDSKNMAVAHWLCRHICVAIKIVFKNLTRVETDVKVLLLSVKPALPSRHLCQGHTHSHRLMGGEELREAALPLICVWQGFAHTVHLSSR